MRLTPASSECSIHLPRESHHRKPRASGQHVAHQRHRQHRRQPSSQHSLGYGAEIAPSFVHGQMLADNFVSIGELNHRERQHRRQRHVQHAPTTTTEYWNVPRREEKLHRSAPAVEHCRTSPRVRKQRRSYDNRAVLHVDEAPVYDRLPANYTPVRRVKKTKAAAIAPVGDEAVFSHRRLVTQTSAYMCYAAALFSMCFYTAGLVYNAWALVTHDTNAFGVDPIDMKYWKATWVFDLCLYAVGIVAVTAMILGILKMRSKLLVLWMVHGAFVTVKHIVQMVLVLTYSTTRVAVVVSSVQLGAVLLLVIFLYVVAAKMEQYGRLTQVGDRHFVESKRTTNMTLEAEGKSAKSASYSPSNHRRPLLALTDGSAISGSVNSGALVPYSPPSVLRREGGKHAAHGETMQVAVRGARKNDRQYVSVIPVDCIPGFDPSRMSFQPQSNGQRPVFIPVYYQ